MNFNDAPELVFLQNPLLHDTDFLWWANGTEVTRVGIREWEEDGEQKSQLHLYRFDKLSYGIGIPFGSIVLAQEKPLP